MELQYLAQVDLTYSKDSFE
ncbi:hypothetical protein K5V21_01810 [Clostridium sardiniense]|uniref:Uncharacterized protein n=1 Tax=Clostridium sardiniense TaxID=29369 RepID=A0ABS7KTP3_CLOSR|nr:hypothetical protein [Clostridium sardiniense]